MLKLLIDLHDGITVAVPTEMLDDVKSFLVTETKKRGLGLCLKHDQVMEISNDTTSLMSPW